MADRFCLARFKNAHEDGLDGSGRGTYAQAWINPQNARQLMGSIKYLKWRLA